MGEIVNFSVELLKQIRDRLDTVVEEQRATNVRLLQVDARLGETNARLDQTNARLDQTNARLEHLVRYSGAHWRAHERRLGALERAVDEMRSTRPHAP
jgi:septal ring factor EnvC (AmiA/AmiB activator)